jgi:hypothetical protein
MKQQRIQAGVATVALSLTLLMVTTQAVFAAPATFPRIARGLSTWMARAMDQCSSSTVSVFTGGLPPGGCVQSNTVTDSSLTMGFMKLRVSQRGRIVLFGEGFTLGDALRVRLVLRVTKANIAVKHLPGPGIRNVTFIDQVVDCPQSPDAFLARPNGAVAASTDLGACLAPNTQLAHGNIEILDVSLINVLNGKTVAIPGIRR